LNDRKASLERLRESPARQQMSLDRAVSWRIGGPTPFFCTLIRFACRRPRRRVTMIFAMKRLLARKRQSPQEVRTPE